jgi:hypothetical protein
MSERDVTEAQIRKEHLAEVDQRRQWAYLGAVLVGGTALMLALVALLGATG